MHRSRKARMEPEPWIEKLILSYGLHEENAPVKAYVNGVRDLSESQQERDGSAVFMLFLSDGSVSIPAVVSAAAWELLQEMEERETFSGLEDTTVCVRKFRLEFHWEPELTCCQFYLMINQLGTTGRTSKQDHTPSCTTLPSVKQQILKTWRSLQRESSVNSVNTQTGFSLSGLMGAWYNDILSPMLNDAKDRLSKSTLCFTSVATSTHWQRERLQAKAEESFSVAVSHLFIPEGQRERLIHDPDVSHRNETERDTVSHLSDIQTDRPIAAEEFSEREVKSPNSIIERLSNDQELSSEVFDQEILPRDKGVSTDQESPWDMFCPAVDLLGTSSSSEMSVSSEPLPQQQSQCTSVILVPVTTSKQGHSSNISATARSGLSIPPYQRPRPQDPQSPTHSSMKRPRNSTFVEEQQVEQPLSPSSWLEPSSPSPTKQTSISAQRVRTAGVHSDGSAFSYKYSLCPRVSADLSKFKIPEPLIQWAVTYLVTPQPMQVASDAQTMNGSG